MTAILSASPWSMRKRRISSSVSEDLPDPPVPVMPSTGTASILGGLGEQFLAQRFGQRGVFEPGDDARQRAGLALEQRVEIGRQFGGEVAIRACGSCR